MHNLVKSESLLQCGLNGYLALEDLCIIWEGGDSLKYLSISMCVCSVVGHVQLFATPWNVAHQASLSMEFSRQKYWSRLPFPSPGNLPDPEIKPEPASWQVDFLQLGHLGCPLLTYCRWFFAVFYQT